MGVDGSVVFLQKVNGIVAVDIFLAIESAHLGNLVKGNTHGALQLGGRKINDALGDGMLDLQTGVELEEVVIVFVGIVQELDCTSTAVTNRLSESLGCLFHLTECFGRDDGWRGFLEDLLETALGGAITSREGHGVTMLVTNDLDFNVAVVLAELHEEDGRSDDLILHLKKGVGQVLLVVDQTNTLAATTLRGLDHDAILVANLSGSFQCLLDGVAVALLESFVGDSALVCELGLKWSVIFTAPSPGPWNAGHASGLGEDVGGNLVAEDAHDGGCWADELDSHG